MAQLFWPFDTATVSEWPGARGVGWADHVGTDFAIPQGTPLKATASGVVDIHWTDGLGAWVIDIITPDGFVVRNGHLSYMAVGDGDWVNAGDYIGNTGGAVNSPGAGLSTGSHLHWEIRDNTGWGAAGWFDPRNLTVSSFTAAAKPAQSFSAVKRRKKVNMFMVYYKDAAPKDPKFKGRWVVVGANRFRELSSQKHANAILAQLGISNALVCDSKAAYDSFCYMAGKPA